MSTNSSYHKGLELAREAAKFDEEKEYKQALEKYLQAIEQLMHFCKYDKTTIKDKVTPMIHKYMARAELIKQQLKDPPKKDNKKASADGGPDDGDEDTQKLRKQLEATIVVEAPDVSWDDVKGLEHAKQMLQDTVILPMVMPHLFQHGRELWRGILLYGPPGTGKSFLAKAVATEANKSTFISVTSSELVSKWQGESEKMVKELFNLARERRPCIIFLDEVDALVSARGQGGESESSRRVKTQFLTQIQGMGNDMDGILVLGATNCPYLVDSAIRRRFEKRVYIALPDAATRETMFERNLRDAYHNIAAADFKVLGSDQYSKGRSGADIKTICKDANMMPVSRLQKATHFVKASVPNYDNPEIVEEKWVPCAPSQPGAVEKTWKEFDDPTQIQEQKLSFKDMCRACLRNKATVGEEQLEEFKRFTSEFGEEGK